MLPAVDCLLHGSSEFFVAMAASMPDVTAHFLVPVWSLWYDVSWVGCRACRVWWQIVWGGGGMEGG